MELNLPRLFFGQYEVIGSTMGTFREFDELTALVAGGLPVVLDSVHPLGGLPGCPRAAGFGAQFGKVVLRHRGGRPGGVPLPPFPAHRHGGAAAETGCSGNRERQRDGGPGSMRSRAPRPAVPDATMAPVNDQKWDQVDEYMARALIGEDDILQGALQASHEAGLPAISVSPRAGQVPSRAGPADGRAVGYSR